MIMQVTIMANNEYKHLISNYDVRSTVKYKGNKIILLKPVSMQEPVDNVFCLDADNNIIWQVENLREKYPHDRKMPYENMFYHDGILTVSTFIGMGYDINPDDGMILRSHIVK